MLSLSRRVAVAGAALLALVAGATLDELPVWAAVTEDEVACFDDTNGDGIWGGDEEAVACEGQAGVPTTTAPPERGSGVSTAGSSSTSGTTAPAASPRAGSPGLTG